MRRFWFVLLVLLLCCSSAFAHPGGTDSKGGHTNHSTGEYHYHHGYPAHQHENGQCPYDFDDKTGQSSGSASSVFSDFNRRANATPKPTSYNSSRNPLEEVDPLNYWWFKLASCFVSCLIWTLSFMVANFNTDDNMHGFSRAASTVHAFMNTWLLIDVSYSSYASNPSGFAAFLMICCLIMLVFFYLNFAVKILFVVISSVAKLFKFMLRH